MDLVGRLIAKAQKIKLSYGDNVFIISNETGRWMAEGRDFPSFEAAQKYVEDLIPEGDSDSVIIINDLGPSPFPEPDRAVGIWPKEWLEEQKVKRAGTRFPERPKKDRRLI